MKKNLRVMLSAFFVLAMLASMLIILVMQAHNNFPKDIKVREDGVTEDIFTVRDLRLCPAESKAYDVDLFCEASGDYNITLSYVETKPGTMKHFVDVVVKVNGEAVYTGKLASLIDKNEIVSFDETLWANNPQTMTVVYTMPYETGDEAQGTTADFDIHLKIQKI